MHEGISIDLIRHFSKVPLFAIKQAVAAAWGVPDANILQHTRGKHLYNSHLFSLLLINYLTPHFAALLYSRVDSKYSLDGQLLFITLCYHMHRITYLS
jgi:hypothetical protein